MRNLILLFSFPFLVSAAQATEVDDITSFYRPLADSEKILNGEVQRLIDIAKDRHFGCNRKIFGRQAAGQLIGNFIFGAVESFANNSPAVDRAYTPVGKSIYRGSSYQGGIVDTFVNLGPTVNVAGHRVGTDKLGHFFDMGWDLYQRATMGDSIGDLLRQSHNEEGWLWGWLTTGVKSYGDIASNFDGHRFWMDLVEAGPYQFFTCENGRLKQVRPFRWADYVSSAWSEAVNCSVYYSDAFAAQVADNVKKLETASGRRYACPVDPNQCALLRRHYRNWIPADKISEIISPLCR